MQIRTFVTFVSLMIFWVILSGFFDFFHIAAGLICCGIVTLISGDLLFESRTDIRRSSLTFLRFILYIPHLMGRILIANIDVAYRILHPDMPVDPGIITIETHFQNDILRTTFANAMTLTPGTITIDVTGGRFVVHALVQGPARKDLLEDQDMQHRLSQIFCEQP